MHIWDIWNKELLKAILEGDTHVFNFIAVEAVFFKQNDKHTHII